MQWTAYKQNLKQSFAQKLQDIQHSSKQPFARNKMLTSLLNGILKPYGKICDYLFYWH
jgi:hypothetical protein